jgi:hypothetical protein
VTGILGRRTLLDRPQVVRVPFRYVSRGGSHLPRGTVDMWWKEQRMIRIEDQIG